MRTAIIAAFLSAVFSPWALQWWKQGDDIKVERVNLKRGHNSATLESSITGYGVVDYVLGARQGQYINVSMASDNDDNYRLQVIITAAEEKPEAATTADSSEDSAVQAGMGKRL